MCITTSPARLGSTRIYVTMDQTTGEHVLGYANAAFAEGKSAMLLPIPSVHNLEPEHFVDASVWKSSKFSSYIEKHKPRFRSRSLFLGGPDSDSLNSAKIFKVGSYTVASADDLDMIPDALSIIGFWEAIPSGKLMAELHRRYPKGEGWKFIVCAWEGDIKAEPVFVKYKPINPSQLFAPGLDSHDGQTISDGNVMRDHEICIGEYLSKDLDPSMPKEGVFKEKAITTTYHGPHRNGDFITKFPVGARDVHG